MQFMLHENNIAQLKKFFYKYYMPIYGAIIPYNSSYTNRELKRLWIRFNDIYKNKKTRLLFKLFFINKPLKLKSLYDNFSESEIELLTICKIIFVKKSKVFSNFFILPNKEIIFSDRLRPKRKNFVYTHTESILFLQFINKNNLRNDFILDVGTGPGTLALGIHKYKRIIGCDVNKRAIEFSKLNQIFNKKHNISFIHKNYLNIINKYKFNTIISNTPSIPNPPHLKTKILYRDGGETGFEFTGKLIEKFLSSSAKKLFLITLSPVNNKKLLIVEFLNNTENIGYEIRVLGKIQPYLVLLKLPDKKQILKTLIKKDISYFCYCFVKIEKNYNKRLVKFQYKDFWIKDIINNFINMFFLHLPNSIISPPIIIYYFMKKFFIQI